MSRTETALSPLRHHQGLASRIARTIASALARRRDRLRLGQLDPHLLRDIGLDAGKVARECAKPIWRA